MALEDDTFLGRWSRRKHAARRGETPPEPAPEAQPEQPAVAVPPAPAATAIPAEARPEELPSVDSLQGLESEYKAFLRPGVDPATRSAALKKLFSDPHFNQMDGLDVYIDDYTKADPIPDAMLRILSQARSLGLFDEEEKTEQAAGQAQPATPAATAALEPPAAPAESGAATRSEPVPSEVPAKTTGA
jgi:hypothetical protein